MTQEGFEKKIGNAVLIFNLWMNLDIYKLIW